MKTKRTHILPNPRKRAAKMTVSESDPCNLKQSILDLFETAGFADARSESLSAADVLAGGLAWCILNTNAVGPESRILSDQDDNVKVSEAIEAALRSIRCPYPLLACQIEYLDYSGIYPVVQWIVNYVPPMLSVTNDEIEVEEKTIQQLQKELTLVENSIKTMQIALVEQNQKETNILNDMKVFCKKIDKDGDTNLADRLLSLLELLKSLERRESDLRTHCKQNHAELKADAIKLERKTSSGEENKKSSYDVDHSLCVEKLNSAKSELAAKARALVLVKRQLADMPSQSELIQYERRFSELYAQIQDKLRQTRKFYGTYNALLEIKELMLKETSLLNSISSQFQDAINSTAGRVKLINSMDEVLKGTQQKLGKVQVGLQAEQKVCDTLKEKVSRSVAEQRHFHSILKTFQEECIRNERLQSQASEKA